MSKTIKKDIRKTIRLYSKTNEKLSQLVALENSDFGRTGIVRKSEAEIIEEAINYYHSQKLGKEVLQDSIKQLQEILSNTIDLSLRTYANQFASSLNHLNRNDEVIKRAISLLIHSNQVFPEDDEVAFKICSIKNRAESILEEAIYESVNIK